MSEIKQNNPENSSPVVGIVMGSMSDWPTMVEASKVLDFFGISHEVRVVSAHRTPDLMFKYAEEAQTKGLKVIIAGAGGAAHLPGMTASKTILPVLGVPVKSKALNGLDSLLSIVQMPGGIPVGSMSIGTSGAKNAGYLAASIIATSDANVSSKLQEYRDSLRDSIESLPDPRTT